MLSGTLRRRLCTTASRSTTHFGYRTVDETDKERLVGNIFDSVASSYDVMNDLMSAGVHRAWKDSFVHMLGVGAQSSANLQMLDVAGGTGDIAFRIADGLAAHPVSSQSTNVDERARVVVCDINKQMLDEGQRRAERLDPSRTAGWPGMEWVVADAQQLPFDDQSFDVYTIAFGIRNVTRIHEALSEVPPPPQTTDHHHHRPPQTTTDHHHRPPQTTTTDHHHHTAAAAAAAHYPRHLYARHNSHRRTACCDRAAASCASSSAR